MLPARALGTVLASVLVLAACAVGASPDAIESRSVTDDGDVESSETTDDDADTKTGEIEWGDCEPDDEPLVGTVECATLDVPLDYDQPNGATIELALVRVPARSDREGALLTNPGGPGGSGVDLVVNAGSRFHDEMGLDNFDIIGFDPRGVDRSNGIECVDDETLDRYLYVDWEPDTPEEQRLFDESETAFLEACQEKYGDELIHYSTENTARDMDAIREGLGDDEISYLGISYGTYLGAMYATMFPDRVRAMVLDAAFEPTNDTVEEQWLTQLEGFEGAFDNWAARCADDDSCAFSAPSAGQVGDRWDKLYDELNDNSVVIDGRHINQSTLMTATISAMYDENSWPELAGALADAEDGDVMGVLRLADQYNQRKPDGTFASIRQSGQVIRCASGLDQDEPQRPRQMLELLRERAPRFSRDVVSVDQLENTCPELVGSDVEPPPLGYDGDAPILVVGGENDPATPFRWAEALDEAMGESSTLMSYTGEGHGAVLTAECVTELEAAVIAELTVPDEGTSCDADPLVEEPEWWGNVGTPDGVSDVQQIPSVLTIFGLGPRDAYSEVRLTEDDTADVHSAFTDLVEDAGFSTMIEATALPGLDDIDASYYTPPSGDLTLLVITVPPEALENEDLEPLVGAIPEGETAVIVTAVELL